MTFTMENLYYNILDVSIKDSEVSVSRSLTQFMKGTQENKVVELLGYFNIFIILGISLRQPRDGSKEHVDHVGRGPTTTPNRQLSSIEEEETF